MLKQIFAFILTVMMFVPPVEAHVDTLILTDAIEEHAIELDAIHELEHHKNDSEEEKNTKHHHHCTSLVISNAIVSPVLTLQLLEDEEIPKEIYFKIRLYPSLFMNELFQPPQQYMLS